MKKERGGGGNIYFKIAERIQELGTYINHDVELKLKVKFDMLRADMGDRLAWLNIRQQNMVQGIENIVSAVDTCFVQNNQRND